MYRFLLESFIYFLDRKHILLSDPDSPLIGVSYYTVLSFSFHNVSNWEKNLFGIILGCPPHNPIFSSKSELRYN
jgi:hypothetical protein